MNREIEFRIWDNDDKHFLSLDDFQKMGCVMINNDGTLFLSSDYRFMLNMMIKLDKYTIQQYTGLKDKNGKKIFEGDIMKNKQGGVGIVKYSKYAEFILDFIDDISCTSFNPAILRNYVVIGNIYENKEQE